MGCSIWQLKSNNKQMKYIAIMLTVMAALLYSCEQDDGIGQFDSIVIDDPDNPYKFQQVNFLVSLENPEYGYYNLSLIDSVEVYVNAKYWGTFSSGLVDTSYWTDRIIDEIKYSDNTVRYLVVAPYQLKTDNLSTASDFVDYLYDRIVLTPGEYVMEIRKLKFKDNNGDWVTKNIKEYSDFEVIENTSSAFIGDFNIQVN